MTQTGKALSSLAEASPRAFGELSPGLMAAPASEAGGEPQEVLLPIISTPTASSSPGEGRFRNLGRSLAEISVAACAVEAAQTGKALSSPAEGCRTRRAFGELSPGLMAALASEAGGEPQEELLSIVSTPTACSSHGEGRFGNLWRRLASLRAAAYAAEAELNAMKREPEEFEKDLLVYPNRSQAAIAASHIQALEGTVSRLQDEMMKLAANLELQDVKGHNYRNETFHGFDELDLITRTFKQVSLKSTDSYVSRQLLAHAQDANYKHDIMGSEGSFKDLACRVENMHSEFHVIKGECRKYLLYHAEATVATPKDENVMSFDQNVLKSKRNYKRHFLTSEDIQGPSGLPSLNGEHERANNETMESGVSLKDLVDKGINIRGKEFKNKWFESDESTSTSTDHSDFEDEVLNLLTETRRPNYRHMPPEDLSLPEISSLDLPLQFPSNQEMSGISSSSSNSSSSSSTDNQTRLDEHDDIYSDRGSIGIATDEEEEMLLAEASVCVADDFEAIELIIRHDEAEVSHLGVMAAVRTDGVPRKILLDQQIVFFAKEKNVTSCAVCISEFDTTDRCIRLPCRHIFHFRCIIQWLLANNTCPVCRGSLSNSDELVNRSGTSEVLDNGYISSASPPGSGTSEVLDNGDISSASPPGSGTSEVLDNGDNSSASPPRP